MKKWKNMYKNLHKNSVLQNEIEFAVLSSISKLITLLAV